MDKKAAENMADLQLIQATRGEETILFADYLRESGNEMMDRKVLAQQLEACFAADTDIIAAYLFGSVAKGTAGALSDVDVAVLLDDAVAGTDYFERRLQMMADLTAVTGSNQTDVIILNESPLTLQYAVLRDGLLLTCHDEEARARFTWQTIIRYLDYQPTLRRYEQAVLDRAGRGVLLDGYNPHRGAVEHYRRQRKKIKIPANVNV